MKKFNIAVFSILIIAACASKKNGQVAFKIIDFDKKIPLIEGSTDSIHYHVEFHFTELTGFQNKTALEKVKKELNKQFFNAEKLEFSSSPEENFKTLINAITPAYREEGLKLKSEMEEMSYILNYELTKSSKILYNKNNILIIEIESYVYAGGAHGLENMQYLHFDMNTGELFGLEQIFGADSKQKIASLIVEKSEEMKKDENSVLFEDAKAELNENFYFDKEKFCFVYNPYEIGPYAAGYITIEIPIEKLQSLILKEGPLGFLVKK